jgi:hypothetical protein
MLVVSPVIECGGRWALGLLPAMPGFSDAHKRACGFLSSPPSPFFMRSEASIFSIIDVLNRSSENCANYCLKCAIRARFQACPHARFDAPATCSIAPGPALPRAGHEL